MRSGNIVRVVWAGAVLSVATVCCRQQDRASSDADPVRSAPVFPDGVSAIPARHTGWPEKVWLELSPSGVRNSDGARVVSHEVAGIQARLTGKWVRVDLDLGGASTINGHVNDVSLTSPSELVFDNEWQVVEDGSHRWEYRIWFNMNGGYYSIYQNETAPHCDDPPLFAHIVVGETAATTNERARILRIQGRDGSRAAFRWVGSARE